MKICIIGPGIMTIPPKGWGAVEILIWDYHNLLISLGHQVNIINIKDQEKIIDLVNEGNFDFIHIHYDVYVDIIPKIKNKNISITSHYPFIDNRSEEFDVIFKKMIEYANQKLCYIFTLEDKGLLTFIKSGCRKDRIFVTRNGVSENIKFSSKNKFNRSIYLSKIEPRKRQYLTSNIKNIDYYGNISINYRFTNKNYKGEMLREEVISSLTDYSNLILLSESEQDSLVIKEAMMAGLGVVLSEGCNYRDNGLFITIIEEEKIRNQNYIEMRIEENKKISSSMRNEIRKYAVDNFGWNIIINKYIEILNYIISRN